MGAGKTVVALCALLTAVQGRFQGALMAPTEVLAEQHYDTMVSLLGDLTVPDESRLGGERPLQVELLSGSRGAADRRRIYAGLAPAMSTSWSEPMPSSPKAWSTGLWVWW